MIWVSIWIGLGLYTAYIFGLVFYYARSLVRELEREHVI